MQVLLASGKGLKQTDRRIRIWTCAWNTYIYEQWMVCHKSVLIPSVSVKSTLSNRNWDGFSMFLDAIASLLLPRSVCPHELTMWDSREALCGDLTLSGLDVMARMKGVERDWVRIKKCACKETTAGGNNIISIRYLLEESLLLTKVYLAVRQKVSWLIKCYIW